MHQMNSNIAERNAKDSKVSLLITSGIIKPKIDLSWGMDNPDDDYYSRKKIGKSKQKDQLFDNNESYSQSIKYESQMPSKYYTNRKSQEQQLDKIMKQFHYKKNQSTHAYQKISELQNMMNENKNTDPVLHGQYNRNKALNKYINKNRQERQPEKNIYSRNNSYHEQLDNPSRRFPTDQSDGKILNFQNSLILNQPNNRHDSIGALTNSQRLQKLKSIAESRVSRRSSSGNKKNQSAVVLGDGSYNQFQRLDNKPKDFHTRIQQMYRYDEQKKNRKISQVQI